MRKLLKRILPKKVWQSIIQAIQYSRNLKPRMWARREACQIFDWTHTINPAIAEEAKFFAHEIEDKAIKALAAVSVKQGGGGAFELLYFLVRHLRPSNVVETGVAAGWSSLAILSAMKRNEHGVLYSSDLPYADRPLSGRFIGVLVDDDLKSRWHLCTLGDRICLPEFVDQLSEINLFHYDSDKTTIGRTWALETIRDKLANNAVLIFDDINDNFHFRDLISTGQFDYKVFKFRGKFIGLCWPVCSQVFDV